MKIITKFNMGDYVKSTMREGKLRIVSIQINLDGTYSYGCQNKTDVWVWFKEFELLPFEEGRIKGFTIEINNSN